MPKTTPENAETVTLLRDHEHRGILHPAGSQITIRPDQRKLLEKAGYIDPRTPYPSTPADLPAFDGQ